MTDIIVLARRHKHIASHYDGCEADHVGCLVNKLADEVERQRAEIERLRAALQESACACSSIRECASEWAKDGKCPHLIARNALEGKP